MKPEAPITKQGQAGADLAAPAMEQAPDVDAIGPTMGEPLAAWLTSPGGGAHDEGGPADILGEKVWAMVGTSDDPTGVGMETAGDAPSSAA